VKVKVLTPRAQANRDVEEALAYYLDTASEAVALGFVDSLERAYAHISRHPAAGSPRYAHELNLPNLRCWQLKDYPHVVF
jgi:toxin ParE1/3/4